MDHQAIENWTGEMSIMERKIYNLRHAGNIILLASLGEEMTELFQRRSQCGPKIKQNKMFFNDSG